MILCLARLVFCFEKGDAPRVARRLLHEASLERRKGKKFFFAYFAFEIEPVNIYRRRPKATKTKYFPFQTISIIVGNIWTCQIR